MRVRGWFVGIDDFQDQAASNLSGAVRDATALHAIFSDGIPEIEATLLTNSDATHDHCLSMHWYRSPNV